MADTYKLVYFNARGRAESIRLIFALAGVEYEDFRIEREEWNSTKDSYEGWGQLPILQVNGKTLCQSTTIARYLAKKFNLGADNAWDAAKLDELADALSDFVTEFGKHFREQDEAKKAEMKKQFGEVTLPKYFSKFDAILKSNGSGFLVGKKVTWVDLLMTHYLEFLDASAPEALDHFPNLKKLKETVLNIPEIKAWVAKRPVTAF